MKNKIDKKKFKNKCETILNFFTSNRTVKSPFFDPLESAIEEAYMNNNQRDMKGLNTELNLMLKSLSDVEYIKEFIEKLKYEKIWDINE